MLLHEPNRISNAIASIAAAAIGSMIGALGAFVQHALNERTSRIHSYLGRRERCGACGRMMDGARHYRAAGG